MNNILLAALDYSYYIMSWLHNEALYVTIINYLLTHLHQDKGNRDIFQTHPISDIKAWIRNYINTFSWDVIIHP